MELMYNMRLLFLYFKTIGFVYHIIGVGSLIFLFVKVLWLNDIQAPFYFMSKTSAAFEGVLGSIVASYIFYIFCIHPSLFKEKKTSALFVNLMLGKIIAVFGSYMNGVSNSLTSTATINEIRNEFSKIRPFQNNAPLTFGFSSNGQFLYADWFEYFQYNNDKISETIKLLLDSRFSLDVELINILNETFNCQWFTSVRQLSGLKNQLNKGASPFFNPSNNAGQTCDDFYHLKELINKLALLKFETDPFIRK